MVRIDFPWMQHFYFWKLVLSHKYSNFSHQFLKYLLSEVKLFYLEATLRLRKYISYLKNEKRLMTSCQFLKYLLCEVKLFYLEATLRLRNEYFFLKNEKQWMMRPNGREGVEILLEGFYFFRAEKFGWDMMLVIWPFCDAKNSIKMSNID